MSLAIPLRARAAMISSDLKLLLRSKIDLITKIYLSVIFNAVNLKMFIQDNRLARILFLSTDRRN
jgi:hypothetical protein